MNPDDIARARAAHPVLDDLLYLNSGTKGLAAVPVVEALTQWTRRAELGGYPGYRAAMAEAEAARRRLARLLNAGESELVFTGNASYSLNAALSLRWEAMRPAPDRPVDVLISDHEYPTTNMVFHYLEQTGRARLVRFRLSADWDEMRASLEECVTDATRLVVASHVCCNTGLRTDAAALAAWCRARGLVSFVDGAQALGQFPIDLSAIGCDLYIGNGHKWLFGPNGVGLLYVRDGFEEHMEPPTVASGTVTFGVPVAWRPGALRFEPLATRPAQILASMNAALDWLESFGPGAIEARQRELTAWVKARIRDMPDRFRLICPPDWAHSSALATIQIRDRTGGEIEAFCVRMLAENKAWLRPVPEFDGLRLSMAYYNTEEEYERFFALLRSEGFG